MVERYLDKCSYSLFLLKVMLINIMRETLFSINLVSVSPLRE
jgi:hypothetical protein